MNTFAPLIAARMTDDQPPSSNWKVLEGDAFDELDNVQDASCKLIVTSPPYNIGKEYERDQRLSLREYAAFPALLEAITDTPS